MTTDKEEQDERRRTVLNDARVRAQQQGTTFATFAEAFADEERGGRFRGQTPQTIVGAEPVINYPAGPNWTADPVPAEPPLGVDVNAVEPVGEPHELKASLGLASAQGNSGDPADAPPDNASSVAGVERVGSPPFPRNKR